MNTSTQLDLILLMEVIQLGEIKLMCAKDDHGNPFVKCITKEKTTEHTDFHTLLEEVPDLLEKGRERPLITMINFFLLTNGFEVIEDPELFKKNYKEQIYIEKNTFCDPCLLNYGEYDLSEVKKPYLDIEGSLIFYAHKKNYPNKVTYNPNKTPPTVFECLNHVNNN